MYYDRDLDFLPCIFLADFLIKRRPLGVFFPKYSDIEVNVSPCPTGKFNGDKPENIVNRLGTNGIQIEQCKIARRDYHDVIAQAVANVIGTRINVRMHCN
jgi:hypothetical protein